MGRKFAAASVTILSFPRVAGVVIESTTVNNIRSKILQNMFHWTLNPQEVESQGKHEESVLYSPISSGSFASESEWETVSEVDFQDVQAITDVTVPVVPWRLIPVDISPPLPIDGRILRDNRDPRFEKYSPFFERL